MSDQTSTIIAANLQAVRAEIQASCDQAGRSASEVRLVAVTKYAQWEWVEALSALHPVFGENRPQQLADRAPRIPSAQWHLIGQLQRNKARLAITHASLIHSVDSLRLLRKLTQLAKENAMRPRVLLQVNVTGEASKSGFREADFLEAWSQMTAAAEFLEIDGLMTMAPASDNPEDARAPFRTLRQLRDRLRETPECRDGLVPLQELSMGMSGDFQVAVEEGATIVRIGSRLYQNLSCA